MENIAVTAVLNIEEAEEEGGSLFNTAGKLVSAHRAQRPPPLQRVGILCEWWVAAAAAKGSGGPLPLVGEPLLMIYDTPLIFSLVFHQENLHLQHLHQHLHLHSIN